jgi:predicted transcriptional regulator
MTMALTPKHLQILKDVDRFSRIQRYHGLLPEKHALFYDRDLLAELIAQCLVEEGTIIAKCGNRLKGYRLTDSARKTLAEMGVNLDDSGLLQKVELALGVDQDELAEADLRILRDIWYGSKISKNNGLMPKEELTATDKERLKTLYEHGYVLYLKVKGLSVKHKKGYILSELGKRLLRELGAID